MSDEAGYNGWSNYETWSVALVVDNDQRTYGERRAIVAEAIEHGEGSEYWSEDERRRYRVADALREWLRDAAADEVVMSEAEPLSFLWGQLVGAALDDVDWDELARHWIDDELEELEPEPAREPAPGSGVWRGFTPEDGP